MKIRLQVFRTLLESDFKSVEMVFEGRPAAGDRIIIPAGSYSEKQEVTVQIAALEANWRVDDDGVAVPEYKAQLVHPSR
jgi:hypothetical protein